MIMIMAMMPAKLVGREDRKDLILVLGPPNMNLINIFYTGLVIVAKKEGQKKEDVEKQTEKRKVNVGFWKSLKVIQTNIC